MEEAKKRAGREGGNTGGEGEKAVITSVVKGRPLCLALQPRVPSPWPTISQLTCILFPRSAVMLILMSGPASCLPAAVQDQHQQWGQQHQQRWGERSHFACRIREQKNAGQSHRTEDGALQQQLGGAPVGAEAEDCTSPPQRDQNRALDLRRPPPQRRGTHHVISLKPVSRACWEPRLKSRDFSEMDG